MAAGDRKASLLYLLYYGTVIVSITVNIVKYRIVFKINKEKTFLIFC